MYPEWKMQLIDFWTPKLDSSYFQCSAFLCYGLGLVGRVMHFLGTWQYPPQKNGKGAWKVGLILVLQYHPMKSLGTVSSRPIFTPKLFLSWDVLSHLLMFISLHPMNCSLPGSSVHGISQARKLEWVATSFSMWKWKILSHVWLFAIPWTV